MFKNICITSNPGWIKDIVVLPVHYEKINDKKHILALHELYYKLTNLVTTHYFVRANFSVNETC